MMSNELYKQMFKKVTKNGVTVYIKRKKYEGMSRRMVEEQNRKKWLKKQKKSKN
jgi:hypothetical protein